MSVSQSVLCRCLESAEDEGMDGFLVYGEEYKDLRLRILESLEKKAEVTDPIRFCQPTHGSGGCMQVELDGSLEASLALLRLAESRADVAAEVSLGFSAPPHPKALLRHLLAHVAALFRRPEIGQGPMAFFHQLLLDPQQMAVLLKLSMDRCDFGPMQGAYLLTMPIDAGAEVLRSIHIAGEQQTTINGLYTHSPNRSSS